MNDTCPRCGDVLDYDEVDVGVGTIRGNPGCPSCHWTPGEDPTDPPAPDADPPEPEVDDPPAPTDGRLFAKLKDVGRRAFGLKYEEE